MDMKDLLKALSKNVDEIGVKEAPLLFQPVGLAEHDRLMRDMVLRDDVVLTPHFFHSIEMSDEEVLKRMVASSNFTDSLHAVHGSGENSANCPTCSLAERMLQRNGKSKLGLQLLTDAHRQKLVKKQQAVEQLFKLVDANNEYIISIIWR